MNRIILSLVFASVISLLLSTLISDSALAQKNTQIFNKDKKMCYLVLAGGDNDERLASEPDPTLLATSSLGAEFKFLSEQTKKGSTSRSGQVDDQKEFTNEINAIKLKCKAGDEAVIFFFGHQGKDGRLGIYEQKVVKGEKPEDNKIQPKIKDVITPKELRDILSGFQQDTTVSFYTGGCNGDAAKETVENAIDNKGRPYGDNFNYWGAKPAVSSNEWGAFKLPLGDETGNKFPDSGNDDEVTTTEEYEEDLKKRKPNWFLSFEPSPEIGDDLVCLVDIVGGSKISLDKTSLLLAGIQSITIWVIPTVAGIAGAGIYLVKNKANRD
ncbi:MAG: hypothetical protein OEL77_05720 [Nitrosopumilus sp.]|nr:hypothetical protein [Nitrosopumilus sp.]MDH3385493.1 hypothetical protein [Nitrosopumilus sp.]